MENQEAKKLKDAKAIQKEVQSLRSELFNLKLSVVYGQLKDVSQFKKLRKNISRLLTGLNG